jgi:hypothetical protein
LSWTTALPEKALPRFETMVTASATLAMFTERATLARISTLNRRMGFSLSFFAVWIVGGKRSDASQ